MNRNWPLRSAIALLTMMTLTSSCTTASQRLALSATTKGKIEAGVKLPDLPSDCRATEPHADITAGAEVRSVLVRERSALDRANGRVTRCAGFYDDVSSRFAG